MTRAAEGAEIDRGHIGAGDAGQERLPATVVALLAAEPGPDVSFDQAIPLLTVDSAGYPHVALLSRGQLRVSPGGSELLAVVAGTRTRANLLNSRRATVMVVSGQTAYYLKLDVCATVEDAGRLGAVLRPRRCLADSVGVDLAPMAFRRSADLAARERWDDDARVLDLLERERRLPMAADVRRLVVGLSGSSAPQLGDRFLRLCREIDGLEIHLVMSAGARRSVELEMGEDPSAIEALADVSYHPADMGAAISSGSFLTVGMVVIPCSMGALAGIAAGTSTDLLRRAADVTLKERRPLILVTRETPLSLIHLRNMETVTLAGATVLPPVPAFYHQPKTIDDLLLHTCGKVLDQLHIAHDAFIRWS